MKTKGMKHQIKGFKLLTANPEFYALACEQGTGKTWMILADAEKQFMKGAINGLLVVAPKGVHTNWVDREIPKHLACPHRAIAYSSGAGKRQLAQLAKALVPDDENLTVVAINVDAVNTEAGFKFCKQFLTHYSAMFAIDESSRIKSMRAERSKRLHKLAVFAKSRRIASGTMISNGPLNVYSQFEFLSPDGGLLGTTSYRSFVAEFAELVPEGSKLVQDIMARARTRFVPQIIQKDVMGRPKYKNLDKLGKMMKPFTFRVTKKECLDLPDKVYQIYDFDLTPAQMKIYKTLEDELRFLKDDGELDTFTALTKIMKLRQAVSGFIMLEGKVTSLIPAKDNPRMSLFEDIIEDVNGQFIVWASFHEEIAQIATLLKEMDISNVQYHGKVKPKDRKIAVDSFQAGENRVFIGQPQSGGIGLTLTAAESVLYYSNDYNLETRLQSEDRAHRIGTKHTVNYIDVAARGTIDLRMAASLQSKEDVANTIMAYL